MGFRLSQVGFRCHPQSHCLGNVFSFLEYIGTSFSIVFGSNVQGVQQCHLQRKVGLLGNFPCNVRVCITADRDSIQFVSSFIVTEAGTRSAIVHVNLRKIEETIGRSRDIVITNQTIGSTKLQFLNVRSQRLEILFI